MMPGEDRVLPPFGPDGIQRRVGTFFLGSRASRKPLRRFRRDSVGTNFGPDSSEAAVIRHHALASRAADGATTERCQLFQDALATLDCKSPQCIVPLVRPMSNCLKPFSRGVVIFHAGHLLSPQRTCRMQIGGNHSFNSGDTGHLRQYGCVADAFAAGRRDCGD